MFGSRDRSIFFPLRFWGRRSRCSVLLLFRPIPRECKFLINYTILFWVTGKRCRFPVSISFAADTQYRFYNILSYTRRAPPDETRNGYSAAAAVRAVVCFTVLFAGQALSCRSITTRRLFTYYAAQWHILFYFSGRLCAEHCVRRNRSKSFWKLLSIFAEYSCRADRLCGKTINIIIIIIIHCN